jgi:hypothetical protein
LWLLAAGFILPLGEGGTVTDDSAERGSAGSRPEADDSVERSSTGSRPEADDSAERGSTGSQSPSEDRVELALDLLANLEHDDLALSAVVDRIETVTTDPTLTRTILDEAERRGLIDREDGRIRVRSGGFVRFERQVVARDGDFDCRRCGAGLSTGHFVRLESGELGPFGSSCVRKVLGRD